jgi:hypothetical protein
LRALYAILIVVAGLWAMSGNARANLYLTQAATVGVPTGVVSEYNAATGEVIKANFVTELNQAQGIAVTQ